MNRLEAVNKFIEEHPGFQYGYAHCVIEDDNIEDYWIYGSIQNLAWALSNGLGDHEDWGVPPEMALVALKFLVSLLDLPMPDDWDDDEDEFPNSRVYAYTRI